MKEKKLAAVEAEIAAERAAALSLSEGKLKRSLAALKSFDASFNEGRPGRRSRSQLVDEAAEACLGYVVQRESMGFGAHNMKALLADYEIPEEVWNRMGATKPS